MARRQGAIVCSCVQPEDMCAEPATKYKYKRTWHHAVKIEQLEPGAWYWYCPESSKSCSRFRAAVPAGKRSHLRFAFFGDMGVGGFKHVKTPGCATAVSATMSCA